MEENKIQSSSEKKLSVIIRFVSRCNINCSYCYAKDNISAKEYSIMPMEILERLTKELIEVCPQELEFIWHGKEPLLGGIEFFKKALEFQNVYKQPNQNIKNTVQTNGLLLTQEFLSFFKDNQFTVGLSLDGPQKIHDAHRIDYSGKGTFSKVMKAVELIKHNGLEPSVLAVVTPESVGHADEIYDFFLSNDIKDFDFLACTQIDSKTGKLAPTSISPEDYANFMIRVFDRWIEDDNPDIHIRTFEGIVEGFVEGCPNSCMFANDCSHFLGILYDGSIYPCDMFMNSREAFLGNIKTTTLKELFSSEHYANFIKLMSQHPQECDSCRYFSICGAGCAYYRYKNQDGGGKDYYCLGRKRLFSHIERKLKSMNIEKYRAMALNALKQSKSWNSQKKGGE